MNNVLVLSSGKKMNCMSRHLRLCVHIVNECTIFKCQLLILLKCNHILIVSCRRLETEMCIPIRCTEDCRWHSALAAGPIVVMMIMILLLFLFGIYVQYHHLLIHCMTGMILESR